MMPSTTSLNHCYYVSLTFDPLNAAKTIKNGELTPFPAPLADISNITSD
jgi:hypothetical protein